MNAAMYTIYYLFRTYNQATQLNSVNQIVNNQFTYDDFRKECFDKSVDYFIKNPLYREFFKAYVK